MFRELLAVEVAEARQVMENVAAVARTVGALAGDWVTVQAQL